MQVEWQALALEDQMSIVDYIEERNPYAAISLLQTLVLAGDSLALFPYRGRMGRAIGTRELTAAWPYIIVYEVDSPAQKVRILRIWHGAQDR